MRWRALILGLVGGLAVLAVAGLFLGTGSPVSHENYERIGQGMPLAEVQALLGGPGVPSADPVAWVSWGPHGHGIAVHPSELEAINARPIASHVWVGPDSTLRIGFDQNGKAVWGQRWEMPREPLLDRLRRWLRL